MRRLKRRSGICLSDEGVQTSFGGGVLGASLRSIVRTIAPGADQPISQRTNSGAVVAGRASGVFDTQSKAGTGWQMLMVNCGWLGLETITSPAVEGMLVNSRAMATTKLKPRKSAFENNCLIPGPVLEQSPLTFKIGWFYVYAMANNLDRQFYRDTRCKPGFHGLQPVSIAARSANEISARTGVTLMIHIAGSAGVEGGFDPTGGVAG